MHRLLSLHSSIGQGGRGASAGKAGCGTRKAVAFGGAGHQPWRPAPGSRRLTRRSWRVSVSADAMPSSATRSRTPSAGWLVRRMSAICEPGPEAAPGGRQAAGRNLAWRNGRGAGWHDHPRGKHSWEVASWLAGRHARLPQAGTRAREPVQAAPPAPSKHTTNQQKKQSSSTHTGRPGRRPQPRAPLPAPLPVARACRGGPACQTCPAPPCAAPRRRAAPPARGVWRGGAGVRAASQGADGHGGGLGMPGSGRCSSCVRRR